MIKRGSRGTSVSKIQYKLGLVPDGIFGESSEKKVMEWQTQMGLLSDGLVGNITWSKMFGCSMDEFSPIGVVVHSMTERIDWNGEIITARELLNKLGLSVHAFIHPSGRIEEMVPTEEKGVHAGVSEHRGLSGLNSYFLGFELLVEGTNDYGKFVQKIEEENCYTEKQINSAIQLTKKWMVKYNIKIDDIVRHSDVSGDLVRGRGKGKVDPGEGLRWKQFLNNLI